jgi:hypothetical protein
MKSQHLKGSFAFLVAVAIGLGGLPMGQSNQAEQLVLARPPLAAPNPCSCPVTNKGEAIGTPASGSCTIVGQGSVKCFEMSIGSVPGEASPESGTCTVPAVDGVYPCGAFETGCKFAKIRLTVSAASCFDSCGGISGASPTVIPVGKATSPGLSAGATEDYDITPPVNTTCGAPYTDVNIVFKNAGGLPIYELRGRFHCGQCAKAIALGV